MNIHHKHKASGVAVSLGFLSVGVLQRSSIFRACHGRAGRSIHKGE